MYLFIVDFMTHFEWQNPHLHKEAKVLKQM